MRLGEEKAGTDRPRKEKLPHRRKLAAGLLAAVVLAGAGAGVFRSFVMTPGSDAVRSEHDADTGLIDWQKAIEAHPDYDKLQTLREECRTLERETQDVEDLFTVSPPATDSKPFDDSVWAKNALDVVGRHAELERKAKRIAEEYRKQTEAEYQYRRKAIDEEYLNAILNLNLKLDNQASMHNPLDSRQDMDAERADWEQQRSQLQQERGERQRQLELAYQREVSAYVQTVLGPEMQKWRQELPQRRAQQQSEAAARQSEAEKRNADTMQRQMETAEKVQQRLEKRQQLEEKRAAMQSLEAHIFNDIAGKAAKIAILHHFTMILVHHPRMLSALYPEPELQDPLKPSYSIAAGISTVDVTDELVQEVSALSSEGDAERADPSRS